MSLSIENLPEIDVLKDAFKKLAILNVILNPNFHFRYHHFVKNWSDGVDMAKIDNGSGDDLFVFFSKMGCVIKGFDHESPISPFAQHDFRIWDGMFEGLPDHFAVFLDDETVKNDAVTFCFWKEYADAQWHKGPVVFEEGEDDGSDYLLGLVHLNAVDFKNWADTYYEVQHSEAHIAQVYADAPLTDALILGINGSCDLEAVKNELKELQLL